MEGAVLCVCCLDMKVTENELYQLFSPFGLVTSTIMCSRSDSQKSLGRAYVVFDLPEDAETARLALNCEKLKGKPIRVIWERKIKKMRDSGKANVYVQNLHSDVDENGMFDLFSLFGTVLCCKVVSTDEGESNGFGFVQFETQPAADKAIKFANGRIVNEKVLKVQRFIPKNERRCNVYVKNIGPEVTEEELRGIFDKCGTITSCAVMKNSDGSSKCFGFVAFEKMSAVESACNDMNGKEHGGRALYVAPAQKKHERVKELSKKFSEIGGKNLFVNNLNKTCDDAKLREMFAPFGTVTSTKVATLGGISLGYGYVSFASQEEAAKAIADMHDKVVSSNGEMPLYVMLAQDRHERLKKPPAEEPQNEQVQGGEMPENNQSQSDSEMIQNCNTQDSDVLEFCQAHFDEIPYHGEQDADATQYYEEQEEVAAPLYCKFHAPYDYMVETPYYNDRQAELEYYMKEYEEEKIQDYYDEEVQEGETLAYFEEEEEDGEYPSSYENEEEGEENESKNAEATKPAVIRYNFPPAEKWKDIPAPYPNVYIPPEIRRERYPYWYPIEFLPRPELRPRFRPPFRPPFRPRYIPPFRLPFKPPFRPPPHLQPLPNPFPMKVFRSPYRSYFKNYSTNKSCISAPRWADLKPPMPFMDVPQPAQRPFDPPEEKTSAIGMKLFEAVEKLAPEMAAEITSMLLRIDNAELRDMIEHTDSLKEKVEEAVAIIMVRDEKAKNPHGYRHI